MIEPILIPVPASALSKRSSSPNRPLRHVGNLAREPGNSAFGRLPSRLFHEPAVHLAALGFQKKRERSGSISRRTCRRNTSPTTEVK